MRASAVSSGLTKYCPALRAHVDNTARRCGGKTWRLQGFERASAKNPRRGDKRARDGALGNEGIDAVGLDVHHEEQYAYNGFNQLTGVTSSDGTATTFGYDGNGNQVRKQDATGLTQYVYDQDNRLVGIALPNGVSNAFEYDANGLRTKKTDSSGTTSYLLDGMSVIAQYAPDRTRQAWYTQSLARIDEVLSVVNGQGKFWYQSDALGSTYAMANGAGAMVARGGYDVFGASVAISGNVGQPFGFTGREHELDSGLVYARARYLQPGVGRWDRPDPARFVEGPNLYAYVSNRPTRAADPSGMFAGLDQLVAEYAFSESFSAALMYVDLGFKYADAGDDEEHGLAASAAFSYLYCTRTRWAVAKWGIHAGRAIVTDRVQA